ncbi:MAG TPA: ureidoglycolate lyase [Rhodospirillales bacterium]|jgi:ureidoglycolate lyase|nr:MAG: Ureidoglycolate lyase [Alphaproteobacteria bacterium MarineAlpha3_Bin1]HIE19757.1 ureidoglycolate lyase [Rhodospirillales bacterium]HIM77748.1 ureidoglycolate lyase [Rhodospirillales bacterium]
MSRLELRPEPLTREAFAPFGDVIDTKGAESYPINEGTADRYHNLAEVDVNDTGGQALISIFRSRPRDYPFEIRMMERHPIASQAFIPLDRRPYLVVVAAPDTAPLAADLKAFLATGSQGINYHRGVWHHPLLVLEDESDFLVIDRGGEGHNLDEVWLDDDTTTILTI